MCENREVSVMLTQEQLAFLEDFQERCSKSTCPGISKESIVRCLLRLFENVEVDVQGIRTEDELLYRLLSALKATVA